MVPIKKANNFTKRRRETAPRVRRQWASMNQSPNCMVLTLAKTALGEASDLQISEPGGKDILAESESTNKIHNLPVLEVDKLCDLGAHAPSQVNEFCSSIKRF